MGFFELNYQFLSRSEPKKLAVTKPTKIRKIDKIIKPNPGTSLGK